ncbi:MAG: hypothetical protein JNK15_22385 [Planctomycetes bacterium]|nr:hypothetical protein [Planctomycetota bacterium]
MTPFAICLLMLGPLAQAPRVEPLPATVGHEVRLILPAGSAAVAGVVVEVELPGGQRRPVGTTDAAGAVRYVPEQVGHHLFVAEIAGVRTLVPFHVGGEGTRWLLALGSVPLGLALLWANLRRARGRPVP